MAENCVTIVTRLGLKTGGKLIPWRRRQTRVPCRSRPWNIGPDLHRLYVVVSAAPIGTMMTICKIGNRLHLSILLVVSFATLTALAPSARADGPTANGLWEKTEAGKPVVWVLVFQRGGTYEGAIARRFLKPGDDPGAVCTKCADDRRN